MNKFDECGKIIQQVISNAEKHEVDLITALEIFNKEYRGEEKLAQYLPMLLQALTIASNMTWKPIDTRPDYTDELIEQFNTAKIFIYNDCNGAAFFDLQFSTGGPQQFKDGVWTFWCPVVLPKPEFKEG